MEEGLHQGGKGIYNRVFFLLLIFPWAYKPVGAYNRDFLVSAVTTHRNVSHLIASRMDLNHVRASVLDLEYNSKDLSLHVICHKIR